MTPETEPALSWPPALFFSRPGGEWRVLYRCDGTPCVMERKYGLGSVVIASDSYFLSNEAMRAERAPRLLAWLAGSRPRIVFDETHLGVRENPGIATLVRKYNLGGLLAAIAGLAALFVWHSTSPFLPPKPDRDDAQIITGKDSAAGFVSLLQRGIPPSRLIEVCLGEWKKSFTHRPGKFSGALPRVEAAAAGGERQPLATYQTISKILAEKK
jgi:hypothetical protein